MIPSGYRETAIAALYRQGRWDSSLVDSALIRAETSNRASDWIDYIDICQAIHGVTLRDWQHVANHYCALEKHSPKLRLKLGNLSQTPGLFPELTETECDLRNDALSSPRRRKHLSSRVSDVMQSGYLGSRLSHYPLLLSKVGAQSRSSCPLGLSVQRHASTASRLQNLSLPFADMIQQMLSDSSNQLQMPAQPSIAVVGNSPAILDADTGEQIDSADLVIRFNNASIQPDKIRHTGRRTDIWVMSPSTPVSRCPDDAQAVIVSGLNALTRPSFYWTRLPGLNRHLSEFPASRWHELVSCFSAPPSAGTLLLASLGSLELKVHCYGFTRNHSDHANRQNHHSDANARSLRHNWQAEARWLMDRFPQREAFIVSSK